MAEGNEEGEGEMSEMVERVARALCLEAEGDPDEIGAPSAALAPQPRWKWYVPLARAALLAIREPSASITAAVQAASAGHPYKPDDSTPPIGLMQAAILWRAGIDKAMEA